MNTEEKILQIITANKVTNFDNIYFELKKDLSGKKELGDMLRLLEQKRKIVYFAQQYYDISTLERFEGFVSPGAKSGVFFSPTSPLVDLGANYLPSPDEISIVNKRDLTPGQPIKIVKINAEDGREVAFVTNWGEPVPFDFIAFVSEHGMARSFMKGFDLEFGIPDNLKPDLQAGQWWHLHFGGVSNNGVALQPIKKISEANDPKAASLVGAYILQDTKVLNSYAPAKPLAPQINDGANNASLLTAVSLDYRDKKFFTIDSITTKDIDDAICWEANSDGTSTIFVAIADASTAVLPGSIEDIQALEKTTTFYLPHMTEHMLPRALSESALSLRPNEEKNSIVCAMRFDANNQLMDSTFVLAKIKSHARLTYKDVDRVLENSASPQLLESFITGKNGELLDSSLGEKEFVKAPAWAPIKESLTKIYTIRNANEKAVEDVYRSERVEFSLGLDGKIESLVLEDRSGPAQKVVEFSMIQANMCAARFVFDKYPKTALFRNQAVTIEGEKTKPAFYDHNLSGHAGLEADFYTHFTSPIRRYCDLVVHRIIKDILEEKRTYDDEALEAIANRINYVGAKSKAVEVKVSSFMINEYLQKLVYKDGITDFDCKVIDFADSGVAFRDAQNVEIFIPMFKVDLDLRQKVEGFMAENPNKTLLSTKKFLMDVNQTAYKIQIQDVDAVFDKKMSIMSQASPVYKKASI